MPNLFTRNFYIDAGKGLFLSALGIGWVYLFKEILLLPSVANYSFFLFLLGGYYSVGAITS